MRRIVMPFRILKVRSGDDSGAAILLALFVMAVVAALSLSIAGVVLSQSEPTQLTRKDIQTVHAAEAGIEAGLTRLRGAGSATGAGSVAMLPCNTTYGAKFQGSVEGTSQGSLTYSTTITYYAQDPSNPALRLPGNQVACSSSMAVPSYALISSTGVGAAIAGHAASTGNRSLEAVYRFNLTNANVAGGNIQLFQTNPSLCISATTVADGQNVSLAKCDPTDPKQLWSYNPDLSISLTGFNDTLCLYANPNNVVGTYMTLHACGVTPIMSGSTVTGYKNNSEREVWSFNAQGEYEGTNSSAGENGYCFISADNPAKVGTYLKLVTSTKTEAGCGAGHDSIHTWQPDAKVGAGHAGDSTNQLVNYKEFGRCLDITGWNVNAAELIDYPCKQTPNPASVDTNQAWITPNKNNPTGLIQSMCNSSNGSCGNSKSSPVCLQAGTKSVAPTSGTWVLTKTCDSSNKQQLWTYTGKTGVNATSYNFKTNNGLCLSVDPSTATLDKNIPWSYIVVETCDGSYKQKWNAPPLPLGAGIDNTWETTGS
jgi:hypothetical protein